MQQDIVHKKAMLQRWSHPRMHTFNAPKVSFSDTDILGALVHAAWKFHKYCKSIPNIFYRFKFKNWPKIHYILFWLISPE